MTGSDLNLMMSKRSITDERKSRYLGSSSDKQAYPIIIHLRLKERKGKKKRNGEKYNECFFANIRCESSTVNFSIILICICLLLFELQLIWKRVNNKNQFRVFYIEDSEQLTFSTLSANLFLEKSKKYVGMQTCVWITFWKKLKKRKKVKIEFEVSKNCPTEKVMTVESSFSCKRSLKNIENCFWQYWS